MTALESPPLRTAPDPGTVGRVRCARDVRRGWHLLLHGAWRLVEGADLWRDRVELTLHAGLHDIETVPLSSSECVLTRTPAEQIAYIEAVRLARTPGAGLGPVGRIHFDDQVMAAIADGIQKGEPR